MKSIVRRSIPAVLAATLVAGAAATIPAIAAPGDDPTDAAEETDGDDAAGITGRIGHRLAHGLEEGELAERLAAELDLQTDVVQDALDAVKADLASERLAEAVENGRLTQDQADRIAAALEEGDHEAARAVVDEVRLEHLEERLAERVEAGELTQEEADEILERAEDGDFPFRGRRGGGPGGFRGHGEFGGHHRGGGLGGPGSPSSPTTGADSA